MEPKFISFNFANFVTINLMVGAMLLIVVWGRKLANRKKG